MFVGGINGDMSWEYPIYVVQYIWLVVAPSPLKNMKVSWDDDIPYIWKKRFMFQTTNQLCLLLDNRIIAIDIT
jgi:hypothetical protein